MSGHMNLTLKVWRQKNINDKGQFVTYQAKDIADDMSFLEMLDIVNEDLTRKGEDPIYFDHDAFDRIQQAGGYVNVNTGGVPDANTIAIPKRVADEAFESATCIGCGACVAACKNASAMLFVSAKISQFALLPQGQTERYERAQAMVDQMDAEGFGNCTNTGACEAECPKGIKLTNIARMNREYFTAKFFRQEDIHA